jgi:nitrate/nitrite-specific signal transduction histidine kinase
VPDADGGVWTGGCRRGDVDIRYDDVQFRLRSRDDGKRIDAKVLTSQALEGHYGLRGMPERAALIGGKLAVWSESSGRSWSCAFLPTSSTRSPNGDPGGRGCLARRHRHE